MADDRTNRGEPDRSRINVNEDYELRYWREKFGVDDATLKAAVKAVGPSAQKVEEYLKSKR